MGPQHTPALAHNALKPQAISRRRAFRKATHRFAVDHRPRVRVSTHICRARARAQQRATLSSTTAVQWVSGGSARSHLRRRGASLRLASHHVRGHPATRQPAPARACPVPSAGAPLAWSSGHPLVSWAPWPPGLLTKRGNEGSTQGGGKGMHNGKQVTKKPQKKVGVPQKKGRSEEGVSAPVCRGTKHYSCTAGLYGGATVSPSASRRQPPPRSTSRPRTPGHPPARAGPRLPHPIGRSHLSAGEITPAVLCIIR
jgi:hypothetical protein